MHDEGDEAGEYAAPKAMRPSSETNCRSRTASEGQGQWVRQGADEAQWMPCSRKSPSSASTIARFQSGRFEMVKQRKSSAKGSVGG